MIALFWLLVGLIIWHFVGYGVLLWLLTKGKRSRSVNTTGELPTVSIVITVHNEEAIIADRITNCLSLDYPHDRLEIIVCSDASTDRTVEIARSFEQVKVIKSETRHLARTQSLGVKNAIGDVVCFTDAETSYDPQCIRRMVQQYDDPKVGGVDGRVNWECSSS
jgi:cellulose synthase/poly-beta-1,6-N-acetylglucosamine synthase-like glycosyltransferase